MPARGRAVIGLRRTIGRTAVESRAVRSGAVGAIFVFCSGGRLGGLGDSGLESGLRHRLRPWFAALDGELAGCLDRRFVRGHPATEIVEHGQPGSFLHVTEDGLQFDAVQSLLFQELTRQDVEHIAILGEDLPGLGVRRLDELAHLVVDDLGDLMAVVGLGAHCAAEEGIPMLGAVPHRAQLRAHSVLGDHCAGDLGGLVDIGGRPCRRLAEHEFLGGTPAHRKNQPRDHLRARHQPLVVLGYRHCVSAGAPAGQNRHLVDRLDVGHRPGRQRVPTFVVGGDLLFVLADDATLTAWPAYNPVDSLFQGGPGDDGAVLTGGQKCGLVDHVGQVGAGHADGSFGQPVQVGVGGDRLALRVHLQHGSSAGQIGAGNRNLAVEAARPQQRRVQDVGPVGGGDQNDPLTLAEAVHLHQ